MRKNVFGRQLKRDKNERKALFKSLLSSLVMYETISTTEAKAKAIKADADKLITKAKKGGLHAYRLVEPELSTEAVKKLLTSIAPRFTQRQGGYTRIIKLGHRTKDNARKVIIEWTEKRSQTSKPAPQAAVQPAALPSPKTKSKEKPKKVLKKESKENKK